jgi:predicted lipid-binding transport protein (Tim44 family)
MKQISNKAGTIANQAKWVLFPVAIIGSPFFGNFLAKTFFRGSEDLMEILMFLIAMVGFVVMLVKHENKKYKNQPISKSNVDGSGVDVYSGGFTDSSSGGF